MLVDHCWNQALDAVDLYPPSPTKLKKSRKLSTRMTLGFKVRGIFLWWFLLLRLDYSMATCCGSREVWLDDFTATCRSREERLDDFTATCRSREEQMKLETIKTLAMDPGYEDVISDFRTFVNGKKFYKRKGKTWKRGYLLYEPPGSDGASLIAAMADFLEFNLYNLDLASFSSFSELKNTLLVGTWSSSVIAIHDLDDFDHCAGMLPNLNNELKGSCLLEFVNGLLSSCGDEQIIVFTTNNRDRHDAARRRRLNEDIYVHKSSPQPVALADEGEIVQLNSSRQKPLVDFEATNIKAYQSSLLVSNSEEKNTREASARRWMTESVCSFVDSMTSISSTDFDALDNRAHLGRAYHSGPIVFNSEKKDTREGLSGECLTKSALSFDDSTKRKSLPFDVNLSSFSEHASQDFDDFDFVGFDYGAGMLPNLKDESAVGLPDGHILPLSEKKIVRTTLKRKCRSMSVLSLVDRQQHVDRRWEDAAKNIGAKRICRRLVIHCVSIAKRMYSQHGIYHRWPFQQDWATMKGYSLGDKRSVEVISLSTHAKLVPRLQLIYITWLGRFSPRPSALGGEIVGPIALSLSESAGTKNIAQRVGQDQSGSATFDSENERTREQEDLEEIYTSITSDDLRRLYGRMNRKDAAASLDVSVSTFKRKCREYGIKRWPHVRKRKVGRPPDQHGERNTSTACKTPLHNVHARMEGEPVGQNQEANEFQRDFMEHSIALNTENDSIIALYSETEAARDSSKWAFQLEGQTMQSTTYPYCDDLVFSQSQIASTEVVNENMGSLQDRRDLLASQVVAPQKEPLLEGHVFGFGNWTVGSCSDLASSQNMRTFSHATESSENLENWLASVEEHLMEENVYGSSRSDPALSQPMHTIHHTMATIPHMMPLPTERQDMRYVKLKATHGDTKIKFQFPLTSGINELKEVMSKILERELGSFKVEYKDEDGEWILMALDEHVREYLQLLTSLGNKVTELKVQDKVPNTTNFCANCRCYNRRSLKRKRP